MRTVKSLLCSVIAGAVLVGAPAAALAQHAGHNHAAPAPRPGLVPLDSKIYLVYANAVPGTEADFATWYDQHMTDIMKLPNFVRAQRFEMSPRAGKPDPKYRYLIIYEFTGDTDSVIAALGPAVKEGRLQAPDKRYVAGVESAVYKAIIPGFPGSGSGAPK